MPDGNLVTRKWKEYDVTNEFKGLILIRAS